MLEITRCIHLAVVLKAARLLCRLKTLLIPIHAAIAKRDPM